MTEHYHSLLGILRIPPHPIQYVTASLSAKMATTDTVISLKESFLRTQVRLLSEPLQPSRNWRDRAPVPEQGELKVKVVQEVLYKRTACLVYRQTIPIHGKAFLTYWTP